MFLFFVFIITLVRSFLILLNMGRFIVYGFLRSFTPPTGTLMKTQDVFNTIFSGNVV